MRRDIRRVEQWNGSRVFFLNVHDLYIWNCNLQPLGKHLYSFWYISTFFFKYIFLLVDWFFLSHFQFNSRLQVQVGHHIYKVGLGSTRDISINQNFRSFGHWERMTMDHGRKGKPRLPALLQLNLMSECESLKLQTTFMLIISIKEYSTHFFLWVLFRQTSKNIIPTSCNFVISFIL